MIRFLRRPQGSKSHTSSRPGMANDWHEGGPASEPQPLRDRAVWIGFILAPIVDALGRSGQPASPHWPVVTAAVAFAAIYIAMVLDWDHEDRPLWSYSLAALQLALAVALTVGDQVFWGYPSATARPARRSSFPSRSDSWRCWGARDSRSLRPRSPARPSAPRWASRPASSGWACR